MVLTDPLHDQLKDLILFLNHFSKFNIYIAEMEYYKHEQYEILIPRLFGAEVKKDVSVAKTRSAAKVWDEESFFAELLKGTDEETCAKMRLIYDFAAKSGPDAIEYGLNFFKLKAEFKDGVRKTVFFANTNGRWNLVSEFWKNNPELREKYADLLVKAVPSLKRDRLDALSSSDVTKLITVFGKMIAEIGRSNLPNK